jgi:cell division protein FtsB
MDVQTIVNLLVGTLLILLGWFGRTLWEVVKELRRDLSDLREYIPRTYVAREDWRAEMRDIKDMLGKIFDKLDGKADK